MDKKTLLSRIAVFGAVAVLSGFLLTLYPFYPLYITVILALVLGAVALEFPSASLLAAILLSIAGAMYQNALIGMVFLVVASIVFTLTSGWIDLGFVVATWVLAFFFPPSLAIAPTILAGLRQDRKNAMKIGALSGVSVLLLSWTRNMIQAGLMLVPFPAYYVPKPIPEPWRFEAFLPTADMFTTTRMTEYFASLSSTIGDYRIYIFILAWAVAGYLTGLLAARWRKQAYIGAAIIGVLPPVIISAIFAQTPILPIVGAFVAAVAVAATYMTLEPFVSTPSSKPSQSPTT